MKEKIIKLIPLLIFILALIITRWVKNVTDNKSSFKYYNYYDIKSNVDTARENLAFDSYFNTFTELDNYDGNIKIDNIEELLSYYKINITKNKTKSFIKYRNEYGFCISKNDFINSFKELFDRDISNIYNELEKVSFVYLKNNYICMADDENVDDDFSFIVVKTISSDNNIVNANIYKYKVAIYDKETENKLKDKVKEVIKNNNYNDFNNLIVNNYNGKIEEKSIQFIEKSKGEYFKYQIVSINTK